MPTHGAHCSAVLHLTGNQASGRDRPCKEVHQEVLPLPPIRPFQPRSEDVLRYIDERQEGACVALFRRATTSRRSFLQHTNTLLASDLLCSEFRRGGGVCVPFKRWSLTKFTSVSRRASHLTVRDRPKVRLLHEEKRRSLQLAAPKQKLCRGASNSNFLLEDSLLGNSALGQSGKSIDVHHPNDSKKTDARNPIKAAELPNKTCKRPCPFDPWVDLPRKHGCSPATCPNGTNPCIQPQMH